MKIKNKVLIILVNLILVLLFVFPIYILVLNSFKSLLEIYKSNLAWPSSFDLSNYVDAFKELDYFKSILNSLIVTCGVTFAIILFCSMAAWVLVRYQTKTSALLFTVFSISVIVPFQCVMLPLLSQMGKFNMLNLPGLMFVNFGFASPLSIIMFHGFIKNVPVELEEAARIDGASQPKVFFSIVTPLIKGISVTVAIMTAMILWNDFLLPSLTINKRGMQTLPLKTYLFFGSYTKKWNLGCAALVLAIIPALVFYLFGQKYIVSGVTEGAMKG